MPGKPGRSGGRRPNAVRVGRPVTIARLREGDELAAWLIDQSGNQISVGQLVTVHVISRTITVLEFEDGTKLKLVR